MAFQISLKNFCRKKIRNPVREAERDTISIAVLFSIDFCKDFRIVVHEILRIALKDHAVIRQRNGRIRAQKQRNT